MSRLSHSNSRHLRGWAGTVAALAAGSWRYQSHVLGPLWSPSPSSSLPGEAALCTRGASAEDGDQPKHILQKLTWLTAGARLAFGL